MTRTVITVVSLMVIAALLAVAGCDKEKIVESTEYVHDVEYLELPPDTVLQVDTVYTSDSVNIVTTDTVIFHDTMLVYDTVVQTEYVFDTVLIYDTVSNVITDTVVTSQCTPNEYLALAALQYYTDPLVLDLIYSEFGLSEGWIFYLSAFQLDATKRSTDVYDIYGYIDFWTADFTGYYLIEYYWRLTCTGGDPADLNNWQMSDPPSKVSEHQPGVRVVQDGDRLDLERQ